MEFFPILRKLEQTDATWQGYVYNLPRGTMKFLLNSTIDTLPTKVNLKLWGKVSNDKCRCCSRQTLNHILNCCGPSLRDGRYTFRHDNVLSYIDKCLNKQKYTCYVDLKGSQTSAGTVCWITSYTESLICSVNIPSQLRLKNTIRQRSAEIWCREKYQGLHQRGR